MRYFTVTHKPLHWPLPRFLTAVSAGPVADERVRSLAHLDPALAARGKNLGEYAALFALRRLLQAETAAGEPEMVGISHYRRFAVLRHIGVTRGEYNVVEPGVFLSAADSLMLPPPSTVVAPAPLHVGLTVLQNYALHHHAEDVLRFFAIAIEKGVISSGSGADFLSGTRFVPAVSVGVYPKDWLVATLTSLEEVALDFLDTARVERTGYQARVMAFCCERLQSLLLLQLLDDWPADRVVLERSVITSDTGDYVMGA